MPSCHASNNFCRFEGGSPDSITHREQDFGYEVIESDEQPMQHFDKVPQQFLEDLIPQQQQQPTTQVVLIDSPLNDF